jgi:carbon starvation protein
MLENAAVITAGAFALLILGYFTYGRFLVRRVFRLDPDRPTPAHTLRDGIDYVPSRPPVLFGHHFASIAGLGPILGPAIAVIWGWVPAVLWVVIGSIFIGAVHDLGSLVVSLRFKGRSVGDVCHHLMGLRARLLALLIIYFLMALAMGAFISSISDLFVFFRPDAVIPALGLILVAAVVGISVYRLRIRLVVATVGGLVVFAGLIVWGVEQPVRTHELFLGAETRAVLEAGHGDRPAEGGAGLAAPPVFRAPYGALAATEYLKEAVQDKEALKAATADVEQAAKSARSWWIGILLAYAFLASVLPVWLLLQPRDYINSFQLYFALATLVIGLMVATFTAADVSHIDAPMFRPNVPGAPPWLPILFVTIACGAVSGFHSLVSSGTTAKQLNREGDALPIGYGAMLTEAALAILVIMACAAGLGAAAWGGDGMYAGWKAIKAPGLAGLATQLSAVVRGGANFLEQIGIPPEYGQALLAVTVVSFALTTLDSATRLLRFNVEEVCRSVKLDFLANRYFGSLVAVAGIAFFGLVPAGQALWTLFGTTNQLLAGLSLLTVSVFLFKLGRPVIYTVVPMVIMLVISLWAMTLTLYGFWTNPATPWRGALIAVSLVVIVMSLWLIVEALLSFARGRGGIEFDAETPAELSAEETEAIRSAHLG